MSAMADQLRRSFSGTDAGCTCPMTVAETLRRTIDGDDGLCKVHDVVAIEQRRLEEIRDIERERVDLMRSVTVRQATADLPECSCGTVVQLVHAGFAGEELPECQLHAAGPSRIPAAQTIGVGDDQQLLALLGQHGLVPIVNL